MTQPSRTLAQLMTIRCSQARRAWNRRTRERAERLDKPLLGRVVSSRSIVSHWHGDPLKPHPKSPAAEHAKHPPLTRPPAVRSPMAPSPERAWALWSRVRPLERVRTHVIKSIDHALRASRRQCGVVGVRKLRRQAGRGCRRSARLSASSRRRREVTGKRPRAVLAGALATTSNLRPNGSKTDPHRGTVGAISPSTAMPPLEGTATLARCAPIAPPRLRTADFGGLGRTCGNRSRAWGRQPKTAQPCLVPPSGAAQESNLPTVGLQRPAGFEDRMGHRAPATPGGPNATR